MRHVDLCSGIGGFALGFEWAQLSNPVLFCDSEEWCRKVLRKHWTDVPILNDVKELANDPTQIPDCDILTAGYPCQPFSLASPKRKGAEDPRHLWPYLLKIVTSKRPTWCVFENVYGHVSMGLDTVLNDLETQGYSARTFNVPALGVDANHKRERLWIVANSNDSGNRTSKHESVINGEETHQGWNRQPLNRTGGLGKNGRWKWEPEPSVGRVANGVPRRMDRIRGLGNAIVPQIAMQIGLAIKEM